MIFISYAKNGASGCYSMYNPNTGDVTEMRDTMWLHFVQCGKLEARDQVKAYPQVALLFKPEDAEAREGVMLNASELKVESKDDKREQTTSHIRLSRVVKPPLVYMQECGSDGVEGAKLLCSIVQATIYYGLYVLTYYKSNHAFSTDICIFREPDWLKIHWQPHQSMHTNESFSMVCHMYHRSKPLLNMSKMAPPQTGLSIDILGIE